MALIEWREEFNTGIADVDHEHRELVELINRLHAHIANGADPIRVGEFLGEVFARIAAHFALEESIMRKHSYDEYRAHKAEHERLLDEIRDIMDAQQSAHPIDALEEVTSASEVLELQESIREIYIDPLIKQYIVTHVNATREHERVYLGASPRGSLALMRTTQAMAMLDGRDFVQPDDVKMLAFPTLGHRVIVSPGARVRDIDSKQIIDECVGRVPVPGARARGGA